MKRFRNPLATAHNHGSAGSGVDHWWAQRFSAILLVPLVAWLVWGLTVLTGADYATAREWIAAPWNSTMAILLIVTSFYHARLGLQVVIEDYVDQRLIEVTLQVLVAIAAIVGALIATLSILKVAFST
ncbi:MAG: succinate dehydrogenase, hydrophobic membrane anchor protein [Xanthomonadaceae bacterium]|nr:succinate dehydrogenase, hydrophobic membrane anchor protein [Xanthomonadaceae bacterium]